jgi:hypothetical protein
MIALYNWLSAIYCTPGPLNSSLISTEKAVPNNPENKANIKYNVPISLAFDERNHLSNHKDIPLSLFSLAKLISKGLFPLDSLMNLMRSYYSEKVKNKTVLSKKKTLPPFLFYH